MISLALLCVVLCFPPQSILTSCRPQYYEVYRRHEVVGISILFMVIDCLGGVFSTLSLAFAEKFDVIAGVTYSMVVVSTNGFSSRSGS